MKKINAKLMLAATGICLLPILFGISVYSKLPERMPAHWNLEGEVDNYVSKNIAVFLIPLIMALLNIFIVIIINKDPKRKNNSSRLISIFYWIIPAVSLIISFIVYGTALGNKINVITLLFAFIGILFIVIGKYMPKIQQNYTIGIKVPWTLNDKKVWDSTHRMAGIMWLIGGIIILAAAFISHSYATAILVFTTLVITIVPIIYAYTLYKNTHEKPDK